jgi:CheY-like chemotaxis protein
VLEPQGFQFDEVESGRQALARVSRLPPDAVILDEGLPDASAAELCSRLIEQGLKSSTPILVYSPSLWHEAEQTEARQAGAWDVIREPIRSRLLVAKLSRLLHIKELIDVSNSEAVSDPAAGVFSLAGLLETLPIVGSIAQRAEVNLSCAVLGPTEPAASEAEIEEQRWATATVCRRNTRASDLCAWIGRIDMAMVAYGADQEETGRVVRRLSERAEMADNSSDPMPISGGVVTLSPPYTATTGTRDRDPVLSRGPGFHPHRIASLSRFAAAQSALQQARESGGGVQIGELS